MSSRFIIIADVHLGLEGLAPNGLIYGDITPVFERAIRRAAETRPAQIVLLGDLVNRGYDHEYAAVKRELAIDQSHVIPVVGNHELQRAGLADFERHTARPAVRSETIGGIRSLILSSGIENLPDTEWQGQLDSRQLSFVDDQLNRWANMPLFVFVHHPIPGTVRDSDKPMLGLINGDQLQQRIERHRPPVVVFSAHTHAASFIRRGRISYLGAPPLGFWPHALLVVDVEPSKLSFSTIRLPIEPQDSPDAGARDPAYRAAREGTSTDQSGIIPLEP